MLARFTLYSMITVLANFTIAQAGVVPCHSVFLYCISGYVPIKEGGKQNLDNYCEPTQTACKLAVEACQRDANDPAMKKHQQLFTKLAEAAEVMLEGAQRD